MVEDFGRVLPTKQLALCLLAAISQGPFSQGPFERTDEFEVGFFSKPLPESESPAEVSFAPVTHGVAHDLTGPVEAGHEGFRKGRSRHNDCEKMKSAAYC